MKIRILASGEVRHIDNSTGSALVSAGLAEIAEAGEAVSSSKPKFNPALIPQPKFEVVISHGHIGGKWLAIRMTLANQTLEYCGYPENVNKRVTWEGGGRWLNGFGREVPAEYVKEYACKCKENPSLRSVGGYADQATREAFSGQENKNRAIEKEAFDREVASGNVPWINGRPEKTAI